MLQLHFTIDNHHLLVHTLASHDSFSSNEYQADIVALQNYAWELSHRCSLLLSRRLSPAQFFATSSLDELATFLTKLEHSPAFVPVCQQTQDFLTLVQAQWERNYQVTSQAIAEMTGFDLYKTFTVRLTHPSLHNGRYLGDQMITWGHWETWPNYSTVYLWHEILHDYFPFDDLSHALIQLITDNELRIRLNAGTSYPPLVGHKKSFPLMETILPVWRDYLAAIRESGRNGDIRAFQEQVSVLSQQ
jgi:hypothetical protein